MKDVISMHLTKRSILTFLAFGLSVAFLSTRIASGDDLQTVALTGQQAPGANATFESLFGCSKINDQGQIAFSGRLTGGDVGSSNDIGIWTYGPNTGLNLAVREGDQTPIADSQFTNLHAATIDNNGRLAFSAFASNGNSGVWVSESNELTRIARYGDVAPGTQLTFKHSIVGPAISLGNNGTTTFVSDLDLPVLDPSGIWRQDDTGSLSLIARERSDAPGTDTQFVSFGPVSSNEQGQVVLVAGVVGIGESSQNGGIWREGEVGLELLARAGQPAPGTTGFFHGFGIGNAPIDTRQITFIGSIEGNGIDGRNSSGIWSERNGNGIELVARSGSSIAPGTSLPYSSFFNVVSDHENKLAFAASTTDGNVGLWTEDQDSEFTLIAREGDIAPGSDFPFSRINTFAFNNSKQAAFIGQIRDPDTLPRPTTSNGIWAQNRDVDVLRLIALEGEMLNVSDDPSQPDMRTIRSLSFESNGFNDLGQLMFRADFDDGSSGIFISNAVAAPEPSLGDCNLDGVVNFLDITPFIAILSAGDFLGQADTNEDGVVNFLDISPFIALLAS